MIQDMWENLINTNKEADHLEDETIRIAVGISLCAAISHLHTVPCGGLVDALRHHCFFCRKYIGKETRHSFANDCYQRSYGEWYCNRAMRCPAKVVVTLFRQCCYSY